MTKPRRSRFSASREGESLFRYPGETSASGGSSRSRPAAKNESGSRTASTVADPDSTQESSVQELALPDTLPAAFRLLHSRRALALNKHLFSWRLVVLLVPGCLALGLLGGLLVPRPPKEVQASVQKTASSLMLLDHGELEAAYTARYEGRFSEAEQLFRALDRKHPNAEMEIEVGRTLIYEGDFDRARTILTSAADRSLPRADANFLLGTLFMIAKAYPDAESSFASAVALDPIRADYCYFWGECLRRQGKVLEATAKFRAALLRNQNETATGLYRLKWWLSAVESNETNSDNINKEIDTALAQPRPPMEALFAAAARDLKGGDFVAAVGRVRRARQRTDPTVLPFIMEDPVFASLHLRPELAEPTVSASPAASPQMRNVISSPRLFSAGNEHGSTPSAQVSASPAKSQ